MCSSQAVELQTMLHGAKEAIRRCEVRRISASDVPTVSQCVERRERRHAAQRRIGTTMHELQQLYGELDVAEPARSELQLTVRLCSRQCLFDPATHGAHFV